MECYLSHAVVLSEDGQVLKVANFNYSVGETVDNIFLMKEPEKPNYLKMKVIAPILVLAASFLLMINFIPLFNPNFATIIIDINPKVALIVNKDNTVKNVVPKNDDAKDLLSGYKHNNNTVEQVTEELIELAITKGYLNKGGSIQLTFDSKNQKWVIDTTESMKNSLAQPMSNKLEISFTITNSKTHKTDIITPDKKKPSNRPNQDTDYSDYDNKPNQKPGNDTDYSDYDDSDDSDYTDLDESDFDESDFDESDYDDSDYTN